MFAHSSFTTLHFRRCCALSITFPSSLSYICLRGRKKKQQQQQAVYSEYFRASVFTLEPGALRSQSSTIKAALQKHRLQRTEAAWLVVQDYTKCFPEITLHLPLWNDDTVLRFQQLRIQVRLSAVSAQDRSNSPSVHPSPIVAVG